MSTLQNPFALLCAAWVALVTGAEAPSLDSHLEPLRPLLEKNWQGAFKNSTPDKPVVDVMRWERVLNGKAIRILHSINDGAYGGETLIVWDEKKESLAYYYFTTAGFMTTGTMKVDGRKVVTHETVSGSGAESVTDVRGTSEIREDGTFHVKTEHRKGGEWSSGHEVTYIEAPKARVVFK